MSSSTAKNLPQFACHSLSDALALNWLTHESKVKVCFRFLVFPQNSIFPTFAFSSSSDLALRKSVRPSEVRRHVRIFLWDICFENHGLNVGFTLFRLGTRLGPAIKINLTWFGNRDLKLVSNLNLGRIGLGDHPGLETWICDSGTNRPG